MRAARIASASARICDVSPSRPDSWLIVSLEQGIAHPLEGRAPQVPLLFAVPTCGVVGEPERGNSRGPGTRPSQTGGIVRDSSSFPDRGPFLWSSPVQPKPTPLDWRLYEDCLAYRHPILKNPSKIKCLNKFVVHHSVPQSRFRSFPFFSFPTGRLGVHPGCARAGFAVEGERRPSRQERASNRQARCSTSPERLRLSPEE